MPLFGYPFEIIKYAHFIHIKNFSQCIENKRNQSDKDKFFHNLWIKYGVNIFFSKRLSISMYILVKSPSNFLWLSTDGSNRTEQGLYTGFSKENHEFSTSFSTEINMIYILYLCRGWECAWQNDKMFCFYL